MDFAAIDFETTGLNPSSPHFHRVLEIGIIRFSLESGTSAEYESVINPQRDIGAFEIHRISAGELINAPTFAEVASDVSEMLNGARLVAHNKNFDLRFLRSELERADIKYAEIDAICTMELVGMIKPNSPRRLLDCCELLGIELLDSHRALNDAKMAANIAMSVLRSTGFPALTNPVNIQGPFTPSAPPAKRGEFSPRTVTQGSYLQTLMERLTHQDLPINRIGLAVAEYLNLLERALEDRRIDRSEAELLVELADRLKIPRSQLGAIHATYFSSICEHALSDGSITDVEENDLQSVAQLLNVGDWREIVNVSSPRMAKTPTSSKIEPGTTVCFTGAMKYPRQKCIDLATAAGLVVADRVTKSLDILVVADPDSQSNKATAAKKYGLRIIAATAFFDLIGEIDTSSASRTTVDNESDENSQTDSGPYEILISIGGRDMSLYSADEAIAPDVTVAKDELAELLQGLPSQEAQVSDIQTQLHMLRRSLPKQATLAEIETNFASNVRGVLTDLYAHLQYLRANSNVVTQRVQQDAAYCADWILETLAMLSLIPNFSQYREIPDEIWPRLLLEQIDRSLKYLRSIVPRLKKSNFLIAEAATDFSSPAVMKRLENCSVVLTGDFADFSREEGRGAILRRGGKSPTSISGRTYALIVGEIPGSSKLQQALNNGVLVLTEEGFRAILDNGPEERSDKSHTKNTGGSEARPPKKDLFETLKCVMCGTEFMRPRVKGRKPHNCPNCNF
jgi:DNA polymerase-3 subunit epsilon